MVTTKPDLLTRHSNFQGLLSRIKHLESPTLAKSSLAAGPVPRSLHEYESAFGEVLPLLPTVRLADPAFEKATEDWFTRLCLGEL